MANLTLVKEGTSFFGDGVRISWPHGTRRPVVPSPPELSLRIRQRIAEGYMALTDDEPNREAYVAPESRIVDPEAVRQRQQAPGETVIAPEPIVADASNGAQTASDGVTIAVADEVPRKPVTTRRSRPGRRRSRTTRGDSK